MGCSMPRDKDETLRLLADYLPAISRAIVGGARDAFDYDAPRMHKLRKVSRRNNTRDEIVDCLRAELDGMAGVRIDDHDQTTYFRILGTFNCRVKKADECGDVELAKTQTSFDFQCNDEMSGLGLPDVENLYFGYIDTSDPRSPTAAIISPAPDGIYWMEELLPPLADAPEITPRPADPEDGGDLVRIPQKPVEETTGTE